MARVTVGSQVIGTLGLSRSSYRVVRLISYWALCWEAIGAQPGVSEFADWVEAKGWASDTTSYRDLKLFREVFPALSDPSPLVRDARRRIARAGGEAKSAALVVGLPVVAG